MTIISFFLQEIDYLLELHCLPVYTIHSVARAKKATVAAISLVDQRVTASSALDHRVEVPRGSLARVVLLSFKFGLKENILI